MWHNYLHSHTCQRFFLNNNLINGWSNNHLWAKNASHSLVLAAQKDFMFFVVIFYLTGYFLEFFLKCWSDETEYLNLSSWILRNYNGCFSPFLMDNTWSIEKIIFRLTDKGNNNCQNINAKHTNSCNTLTLQRALKVFPGLQWPPCLLSLS